MSTDSTARPVGLGQKSARGMVFLLAGSMTAKVISIATQIALSWLLSDSDYGVVGLAFTIAAFIQVIEQAGVVDVLVQRRNLRAWVVPGFWLALLFGVASCLLVMLSAPVAAQIYRNAFESPAKSEQLFWVLLVLAPASIPNSLTAVPRAVLSRNLRFRALAAINLINIIVRMALTVLFAAIGFGPYSFVAPVPITSTLMAVFLWWWVRPQWALRPRVRRWRFLLGDSTRSLGGEVARVAIDQSDYILLGLFRTVELVGLYVFAFNFSIQLMQLFAVNLSNILFPALTKLNAQPHIQFQGFLKAQRILAMLGIGSCLIQAAAAKPLAHLVFAPKWEPAIIVMQLLTLGMATRMIAGSSYALMKSQGRFHTIAWLRGALVAVQVAALWLVLARGGGLAEVAAVVALIASAIGPLTFYLAIRPYGASWGVVVSVLAPPLLCGVTAVGTAWYVAHRLAAAGYGDLTQLLATVLISLALYALLAWFCMRPICQDLLNRLRHVLPRRVVTWAEGAANLLG